MTYFFPAAYHSLDLSSDSKDDFPVLHYGFARGDNLGYFLQISPSSVVAVDSPNGSGMLKMLRDRAWKLEALLLTHTHHDHVVDLPELLDETGCTFYHPKEAKGIPAGHGLEDGDCINLLGLKVEVLETSGHSPLDLSFWFPGLDLCFCGDTLFAWGCGRMFAGPPERFWKSLLRLRSLPEETLLCCGHDYAEENRRFYRQIFPNGPPLSERTNDVLSPMRLRTQIKENPFLKADNPDVARTINCEGQAPEAIFKKLREYRNQL